MQEEIANTYFFNVCSLLLALDQEREREKGKILEPDNVQKMGSRRRIKKTVFFFCPVV